MFDFGDNFDYSTSFDLDRGFGCYAAIVLNFSIDLVFNCPPFQAGKVV